jgi:phosphatidylethanolamine-binding protein (PEBP) family uncharacterized protein
MIIQKKQKIMKAPLSLYAIFMAAFTFISFFSCEKQDNTKAKPDSGFFLSSPAVGADSLLPTEYTCDGESSTLPLQWSGFPSNTVSFALIMHHVASPADIHWYWVLYDIPLTVTSLPKNATNAGILGTNSVNDQTEYAPPCSQGPGRKDYILTIYALSGMPEIKVPPDSVDMDYLLNAIRGITISSASMTVWYSRGID